MTKKNLLKVIAFALILLISVSPVLFSGELLPTQFVPHIQDFLGDDFLYGKAYTNDMTYYKFNMIHEKDAELLIVGTSRVLQFKKYFFNDDVNFYNAGSLAPTLPGLKETLYAIEKDALPDVLVLGLDEYFFNPTWYNNTAYTTWNEDWLYIGDTKSYNSIFELIAYDFFEGKLQLHELIFNFDKIGVNAKVNGNGMDAYGSYVYGSVYKNPTTDEERVSQLLDDIKNATGRYPVANDVEQLALNDLTEIALFCNENDIKLITFTPPLSNSAMSAIESRDDMQYISKLKDAISKIASENGFEFYDFTNPETLDLSDSYFIDGYHGSDSAYLLILKAMLESDSILNNYADINKVNGLYSNRVSDLQVIE